METIDSIDDFFQGCPAGGFHAGLGIYPLCKSLKEVNHTTYWIMDDCSPVGTASTTPVLLSGDSVDELNMRTSYRVTKAIQSTNTQYPGVIQLSRFKFLFMSGAGAYIGRQCPLAPERTLASGCAPAANHGIRQIRKQPISMVLRWRATSGSRQS